MRNLLLLASLLLATSVVAGCDDSADDDDDDDDDDTEENPDPDGDGLTTIEEEALGTDPNLADTDADGLTDGDEGTNLTNPLDDDSDDDGYLDGAEVEAGTNPNYVYSHPYTGGYNVGWCENGVLDPTDQSGDGTYTYNGTTYEWDYYDEGDVIPNITLTDQYGEEVDLYSFCGQHIMIVIGAFW